MHVAVTQFNTGTAEEGGWVLFVQTQITTHQQGRKFQLRLLKKGIQSAERYIYHTQEV